MTAHYEEKQSPSSTNQDYSHPVGGDDPDFGPMTESTPVLCKVPGLKSVLPQCRW